MAIVLVWIDLTKSVFALHGVGDTGKAALVRPAVRRDQLMELVGKLPSCTIGSEARSGAHHWARESAKFGHTVKLMAPKLVVSYRLSVKRRKYFKADVQVICEPVQRPKVRIVPVKCEHAQMRYGAHRAQRTLLIQRAKSAVLTTHQRSDRILQWVVQLKERVEWRKAVVDLANKNAQILWVLMTRGTRYDSGHVSMPLGSPAMTPAPPCTA